MVLHGPFVQSQNSVEWAQKKGLIEELKSTTGKAKLLSGCFAREFVISIVWVHSDCRI